MSTIVTRAGKGSPLTHTEVDANFTNLNNDKAGYVTGEGGTVTQATSKATAVTLSKKCGQITMNAASLAADTAVSFTFTNTTIATTDLVVLNHDAGGTPGSYLLNAQPGTGSAVITIRNVTAAALAEAVVIRFAIIKGVNA
jgi:hypothetical protein